MSDRSGSMSNDALLQSEDGTMPEAQQHHEMSMSRGTGLPAADMHGLACLSGQAATACPFLTLSSTPCEPSLSSVTQRAACQAVLCRHDDVTLRAQANLGEDDRMVASLASCEDLESKHVHLSPRIICRDIGCTSTGMLIVRMRAEALVSYSNAAKTIFPLTEMNETGRTRMSRLFEDTIFRRTRNNMASQRRPEAVQETCPPPSPRCPLHRKFSEGKLEELVAEGWLSA